MELEKKCSDEVTGNFVYIGTTAWTHDFEFEIGEFARGRLSISKFNETIPEKIILTPVLKRALVKVNL